MTWTICLNLNDFDFINDQIFITYFFQFSEVRTIINELIEQFYCNLQTGYRIRKLRIIKKMEYDRLVYLAKPTIDLKLSTETESFLTLLLYAGYLTSESLKNEEGFILKARQKSSLILGGKWPPTKIVCSII